MSNKVSNFKRLAWDLYNQIKITFLSIKYGLMREMLNKASFLINVIFMVLNNSAFILQWIILYSLRSDVGGYSFDKVLLLWGIAASTYGFSHFFFKKVYSLSDIINYGKLDSYLVQPKNVLLSAITSEVSPSALGDIIYGIIMVCVSGVTFSKLALFILFTICGGIIMTNIAIILGSLSFLFAKSDMIADVGNSFMAYFGTYPDGIFKGTARILLFTLIPVGIANYIPVWVITKFNINLTIFVLGVAIFITFLAFEIFYIELRRYSSFDKSRNFWYNSYG